MNKKNFDLSETVYGILLIMILAVVPLIVHLDIRPMSEAELEFIRSDKSVNDVFSYCKAVLLCIFTVLILINIALEFLTTMKFDLNIFKSKFVMLMLGYGLIIILSALFSPYGTIAFDGAGERYEGMWVLLCYVIVAISAFMFVKTKKQLNFIIIGIFLSVFFVGIIGSLQYIGIDFFKSDLAAKLVMGEYYESGKRLGIKFTEVYSTLYNPDCVGLYATLLLPFLASMAIFLKYKNPFKYISIFLFVLLFLCLLGCDATGGIIGFIGAVAFVITVLFAYFIKNYKSINNAKIFVAIMSVAIIVVIGCCIGVPQINTKITETLETFKTPHANEMFEYQDYIIEGNKGIIKTKYGDIELLYNPENKTVETIMPFETVETAVHGIETNKDFYKQVLCQNNVIKIDTVLGNIEIMYTAKAEAPFVIKGFDGEQVNPKVAKEENAIICYFNVKDYGDIKLSINNGVIVLNDYYGSLSFIYENNTLKEVRDYVFENKSVPERSEVRNLTLSFLPCDDNFTLRSIVDGKPTKRFEFKYADGILKAVTKKGKEVDLNEKIPALLFENEYFANGRGFIWSRSIPIMFNIENLFVGSGPDTFAIAFPQEDMAAKTRTHGNPDIIVDKPHNLFIQTSVNTGLISLIIIMTVFAIYIFTTIKKIISNKERDVLLFATRLGILGGIIGYLITGLTTDSVVSVAPIFWLILGVGFAVNNIKDKDAGKKSNEMD